MYEQTKFPVRGIGMENVLVLMLYELWRRCSKPTTLPPELDSNGGDASAIEKLRKGKESGRERIGQLSIK